MGEDNIYLLDDFSFAVLECYIKFGYGKMKLYDTTFFTITSDETAIMTLEEYHNKVKECRETFFDANDKYTPVNFNSDNWVDCNTQLPEPMKQVLCLMQDGEYKLLCKEPNNNYWQSDFKHIYRGDLVTHWQPLPDYPNTKRG